MTKGEMGMGFQLLRMSWSEGKLVFGHQQNAMQRRQVAMRQLELTMSRMMKGEMGICFHVMKMSWSSGKTAGVFNKLSDLQLKQAHTHQYQCRQAALRQLALTMSRMTKGEMGMGFQLLRMSWSEGKLVFGHQQNAMQRRQAAMRQLALIMARMMKGEMGMGFQSLRMSWMKSIQDRQLGMHQEKHSLEQDKYSTLLSVSQKQYADLEREVMTLNEKLTRLTLSKAESEASLKRKAASAEAGEEHAVELMRKMESDMARHDDEVASLLKAHHARELEERISASRHELSSPSKAKALESELAKMKEAMHREKEKAQLRYAAAEVIMSEVMEIRQENQLSEVTQKVESSSLQAELDVTSKALASEMEKVVELEEYNEELKVEISHLHKQLEQGT